jgi:hypothetical protein
MPEDDAARPGSSPAAAPGITTVNVSHTTGLASKAEAAARQIADIWRERRAGDPPQTGPSPESGLLQIVFFDPGPGDGADPHGMIRDMLTANGVPGPAVRLTRDITDATTMTDLARECRDGTVSFLITSTGHADIATVAALGRDVAIHHLDVPHSVLDARSGAEAFTTATGRSPLVFRYVSPNMTFDHLHWEAIRRKRDSIAAIMNGIAAGEDTDEYTVSYVGLQAQAAGNLTMPAAASEPTGPQGSSSSDGRNPAVGPAQASFPQGNPLIGEDQPGARRSKWAGRHAGRPRQGPRR